MKCLPVFERFAPFLTVLFALALPAAGRADEERVFLSVMESDAIAEREGEVVTVYGQVSSTGESESGMNFVNFDGADFNLIAFSSDVAEQFPGGEPHEIYDGKRIAVTGPIAIYRDRPQIKLTDPSMVRILDPEEVFPPEKKATEEPVVAEKSEPEEAEAMVTETAAAEPETPPVDWRKYFQ